MLRALFFWNFGTLLARFGEPNRDRLLAALHGSSLPPLPERSVPFFSRRTALSTLLPAAFPYLRLLDFLRALAGHSTPSDLELHKPTGTLLTSLDLGCNTGVSRCCRKLAVMQDLSAGLSAVFEPWQHFFAVKLNHLLLICLARMNIHDSHSALEKLGHGMEVNCRICPHRPVAIDFFERYFGVGRVAEFLSGRECCNTS